MDRGQPTLDRGQSLMECGQLPMNRRERTMVRGQPLMGRGEPTMDRGNLELVQHLQLVGTVLTVSTLLPPSVPSYKIKYIGDNML